jgi:hypothetical protein
MASPFRSRAGGKGADLPASTVMTTARRLRRLGVSSAFRGRAGAPFPLRANRGRRTDRRPSPASLRLTLRLAYRRADGLRRISARPRPTASSPPAAPGGTPGWLLRGSPPAALRAAPSPRLRRKRPPDRRGSATVSGEPSPSGGSRSPDWGGRWRERSAEALLDAPARGAAAAANPMAPGGRAPAIVRPEAERELGAPPIQVRLVWPRALGPSPAQAPWRPQRLGPGRRLGSGLAPSARRRPGPPLAPSGRRPALAAAP